MPAVKQLPAKRPAPANAGVGLSLTTPQPTGPLFARGNAAMAKLFRKAKGESCPECEEKLHRKAGTGRDPAEVPLIVYEVLRSPGRSLDDGVRQDMETRFGGADFSGVRVHTDAKAAESAEAVNAEAYTVGQDVVFGDGAPPWASSAGNELLAHELAHVMQSDGVTLQSASELVIGATDGPAEREAGHLAATLASSHRVRPELPSGPPLGSIPPATKVPLHRQVAEGMMAAGTGLLAADAELAPAETAAGPPGWLLAAGLGVVGAGLLGAGYLLSKRGWNCTASCNVHGTEPHCTGRVTGESSGPSEEIACRSAKRVATQSAPRGCYARHCQCSCTH